MLVEAIEKIKQTNKKKNIPGAQDICVSSLGTKMMVQPVVVTLTPSTSGSL